jgi:hypothetical protein
MDDRQRSPGESAQVETDRLARTTIVDRLDPGVDAPAERGTCEKCEDGQQRENDEDRHGTAPDIDIVD